ncbi:hypothetical protein PG990_011746 [Apiospora arundinis]
MRANYSNDLIHLVVGDMLQLSAVEQAKKSDMNKMSVSYYTNPFAPQLETSLPQPMERAGFVLMSLKLSHRGNNGACKSSEPGSFVSRIHAGVWTPSTVVPWMAHRTLKPTSSLSICCAARTVAELDIDRMDDNL